MTSPGTRLGVAVSGGADSVALLHILHRLAGRLGVTPAVLHVNHQLRGAESDGDEEFVRALAGSLGLPVFTKRTQLGHGNLEQEARDARREFFQAVRREHGLDRIGLGHTRSDQAETVLFRFLRGSGTAGLAGMRFVTPDGLIRPLLTTGRDEVRGWVRSQGICWREDSTNSDVGFARNRLRQEVIPALTRGFNPNLEAVLAGLASVAQAEEEYWDNEVSTTYGQITERTPFHGGLALFFQVADLNAAALALQRRLIRKALVDLRGDLKGIDLAHIEAILGLNRNLEGHDRVIVPGVDAIRSYGTLLLTTPGRLNAEKRNYRVELEVGRPVELPYGIGQICIESVKSEASFCANFKEDQYFPIETVEIDERALTSIGPVRPLYMRNWEPGDELLRPGHKSAEKLKALFQEHKILLWERKHWPVLVCGDEIVWSRRFGIAANFQASAQNAAALRLCYGKVGRRSEV